MSDFAALIGRILMSAIFISSGLSKAMAPAATKAMLVNHNLPVPDIAFLVVVLIELGVGLAFLFGLLTRASAIVLAGFCIATALIAHSNFADQQQMINFMKNVAMGGGFLFAAGFGGGRFSLDRAFFHRRATAV